MEATYPELWRIAASYLGAVAMEVTDPPELWRMEVTYPGAVEDGGSNGSKLFHSLEDLLDLSGLRIHKSETMCCIPG